MLVLHYLCKTNSANGMRKSLSARLTYRIMAVVMAMMVIITGVVYMTVKQYMLDEAKQRYESVLLDYHEELRRHLAYIYVATRNNVHDIERDISKPEEMFAHVERITKDNPTIVCCALLFEPDYYKDRERGFIACARRLADGSVRVVQIDSTYRRYYDEAWFRQPLKNDADDWTEVYFESPQFAGSEEPRLLTTFLVPIHNAEGRPVALLCADLSLEWLRNEMMEDVEKVNKKFESGSLKHKSYSFIIDRHGHYIIHPDKSRMLTDTLASASMLEGERGATKAVIDGVESWLYYRTVKHVEWTIVIAVPKEVILQNGRMLNVIILAVMAVGLAVIYLFCRRQIKEVADPVAAQQAVMEREMNIAHNIQKAMLPSEFTPRPLTSPHAPLTSHLSPLLIHATQTPALDVGGDLYDYCLRDNRLYFCIGDVSGKGVPAALLMAVVQTMFHNEAKYATRASDIVAALNDIVSAEQNTTGFFVTMFVGILDLTTGLLDYCNAGHEIPELVRDGALVDIPAKPNIPVGALDDWAFEGQQQQLQQGDLLFLYTDGLSEAENVDQQLFGRKRVEELVLEYGHGTPQQLIDDMMQAVHQHAGSAVQNDDITMLAIRIEHLAWSVEPLEVRAVMDEMDHVTAYVVDAAQQAGMSELETKRLRLAVEEVAANIVNYSGATSIRMAAAVDNGQLVVTIMDDGQPFDPTTADATDLSIPADQRPPGGMGIVLLRQMTDSQEYEYRSGRNVLTVRKKL